MCENSAVPGPERKNPIGHDLLRCTYPERFVSAPELIQTGSLSERATLEILWQQDVSATVLARGADGSLSAGDLHLGIPAVSDLGGLGQGASARRVGLTELIGLRAEMPPDLELGGSARATFAVLDLADRSVTEGLLHPQLQHGGRTWLAYWGATIDEPIQEALDAIAAALPEVCADAFDGDRDALVHDLYACAVDQIARDRLRTAGIRLGNRLMRNRPSAPELFLDGLTSTEPELPPHAGLGALERRLTDWVDRGLERRSSAPWLLSLRLDERSDDEPREDDAAERSPPSCSSSGCRQPTIRRWPSPRRCSMTAAMRSSASSAPPTRGSPCTASSA